MAVGVKLQTFSLMKNIRLLITILYLEKLMAYFQNHFNTPAEAKLENFSSQNLIIFTIISNSLVPTDGHRTDANKIELYLFYCFVEKIRIDLALSCVNFCSNWALIAVENSLMKSFLL